MASSFGSNRVSYQAFVDELWKRAKSAKGLVGKETTRSMGMYMTWKLRWKHNCLKKRLGR